MNMRSKRRGEGEEGCLLFLLLIVIAIICFNGSSRRTLKDKYGHDITMSGESITGLHIAHENTKLADDCVPTGDYTWEEAESKLPFAFEKIEVLRKRAVEKFDAANKP